ncbi:MAG TPA: hypothetical protein PKI01_05850 [Bacteroidales bacterium]|nr:hypothetical protein [Bacteroidales bacterium]
MKSSSKKALRLLFLFSILSFSSINSFAQEPNTPLGVSEKYVFALTGDTNYQVIGLHEDGSVMCIRFRQNSPLVEKIAFRKSDTSEVFLMLFDSTGKPSIGAFHNQIFLFGNHKDRKADIIICKADGTVKEIKDVDAFFPYPVSDIKYGKLKTTGPASGKFSLDPLTISDALGYAATGFGIMACGASVVTGGAFALPCAAALIDIASKVIPEENKKTKATLDFAGSILSKRGLLKFPVGRLEKWASILNSASKGAGKIENWLNESAQRNKIKETKEQYFSASFLASNPGNSTSKPDINLDDFNSIISLYNECEAKMAELKKKKDEIAATITKTNYETVGPQVAKLKDEIDATKKQYETKINAIAEKKTIKYGFSKVDGLPYSISRIVISGAKWNSTLYLNYIINFTASPVTETDNNFNPPQTVTKVLCDMQFDIMDKDNEKITPWLLSINKQFRTQGFVKGDMKIDFFKKTESFKFNTKEYKQEFGSW